MAQEAALPLSLRLLPSRGWASNLLSSAAARRNVEIAAEPWRPAFGEADRPTGLAYRREIDGLRAVAVVPVILFHAGFSAFSGGFVGVDVFFVISGYLITSLILTEKQAGSFSLLRFYERRARRILPALFLVVLFCLPFAWLWLLPADMEEFSQSLLAVATFSSNIFFWRQSGYFDTAVELKPLLHTWSLAIEEQYYLLFPVLLLAAWRLGRRFMVGMLAALALASLALAQWGAFNRPTATFYLLPTRGWELLLGALAALYLMTSRGPTSPGPTSPGPAKAGIRMPADQALSLGGLASVALAIALFDGATPFPSLYALLPTAGTVLVILFATPQTIVGRILAAPILVRVGLISYSAYLWHQPLFSFAWHRSGSEPGAGLLVLLAAVSVVLAFVTWKFVETPCRDRKRLGRVGFFSLLAGGCGIILAFGLPGSVDGYAARYALDAEVSYPKELRDRYVFERMHQLNLADFSGSARAKVLVVGDSFAGDLTNALFESGLASRAEISTYEISKGCGNLFLNWDFSNRIAPGERNECRSVGWYNNPILQGLLARADAVLLASNWLHWVAQLLPESVANIQRLTGKKVIVLGPKNFGSAHTLKQIGNLAPDARRRAGAAVLDPIVMVNAYMRQTLPASIYVDTLDLICGSQTRCPTFTENGELISYDGAHLTKAGARYFGEKLQSHPIIVQAFAGHRDR
jgi:peptidoglycan/LPS O-acetylase OafA/YrhL